MVGGGFIGRKRLSHLAYLVDGELISRSKSFPKERDKANRFDTLEL
jgi:hypothetical protein